MLKMEFSSRAALDAARKAGAQYWAALLLMVASLAFATWLTPHATWYERLGRPDYQTMVPASFGDWVDTGEADAGVVSPVQGEALRAVYSQIVSRTYLHKPTGRRIMLSLAYGDVQQGTRQLHRPESCYSSQGFAIKSLAPDRVIVDGRSLDVFRMTATIGARNEQVTYWIRMGDRVLEGPPYQLNMTRMTMGLKGMVADGLLFRVSEIATEARDSDPFEDHFVADLLRALSPAQQAALVGASIPQGAG
jgi:EpsI family protein